MPETINETTTGAERPPSPSPALAIVQPAGPDGELLAVCASAHQADDAEADRIMDCIDAMPARDPAVLDALAPMQPLVGAYLRAVGRAAELPALTGPGLVAKAALLLLHLGSGEGCEDLAASLARDVVGERI